MDDAALQSFSQLGVGGLDAILQFSYDNGFVLFSEHDVKQFFLHIGGYISEDDRRSEFISKIVEEYSGGTDAPAGLYVTANSSAALNGWLAEQIGRIYQRIEKSDQDLLQKSKARLLACISPRTVISSLLEAWYIVEQFIIQKGKGKNPWWREIDLLIRKGDLSFRSAENIKSLHIVVHTVLANDEFARALDADVLATLLGLCFVFSTKLI
jgi:hypothetical protein